LETSEQVDAAEELIRQTEETTLQAMAEVERLEDVMAVMTNAADAGNSGAQYKSAMYFVDKEFEAVPSTCTGDSSESPVVGTFDSCARACDNDVHECVGFQYVHTTSQEADYGLCFLFKKLKTVRYYTGCGEQGAPNVKCYAKFFKFEGTSIAPDASGKCENCLKEAKQADRCV